MSDVADTRLDGAAQGRAAHRELAREVCQRTASAATIEGSMSSLGSQYVVGLKAVNCRTGDVLAKNRSQLTAKSRY